MASRRVKSTVNNNYVQPLKLCFKNKTVVTPSCNYNSLMTKTTHRGCNESDYKIKSWMKFNSETFDGIQVIAGLYKNNKTKTIGTCDFKVYSISIDDNWTETLLFSGSGTPLPNGSFSLVIPENSMSPSDITGEVSFKLEVRIERVNKKYDDFYYFNHIGLYGSFIRLKKEVEFLDLTKLDE